MNPPTLRWLERLLVAVLDVRDQETITGDLLEEYTHVLAHTGALRANLWYLRQIISFTSVRVRTGSTMKQLLLYISAFAAAAGIWLAVMENVLKHSGYELRVIVDACIVLEAVTTLLLLLVNSRPIFRYIISAGALAVLSLGAASLTAMLRGPHFEGFVLIIGLALILEGVLTPLVMLRSSHA